MSEPQLERSVLEAKEREELFAIADALGTSPTSRAKKSDLVTVILRATGVEVGPDPALDKPKRTRARKAAPASVDAVTADSDAPRLPLESVPATGNGDDVESPSTSEIGGPRPLRASGTGRSTARSASARAAAGRSRLADAPPAAGAEVAEAGQPADSNPTEPGTAATRRRVTEARSDPGIGRLPGGESSPPGEGRQESSDGRQSAGEGRSQSGEGRQQSSDGRQSAGEGRSQSGDGRQSGGEGRQSGGEGRSQSGEGRQTGGEGRQSNGEFRSSNGESRPGGDSRAGRGDGRQAYGETRDEHADARNGSASEPVGDTSAGGDRNGSYASQQSRFDGDAGNRRNRRRRGRDRVPERVGSGDLPGQAPEGQFSGDPVAVTGYLDLRDEGYGFLRTDGFLPSINDVYVSISQVRRFALRKGDYLEGTARPAGGNEKYPALLRIDTVSGLTPDEARVRPRFESLTPLFPDQKLHLEMPGDPANMTARIVDLISPIGKGQRGLIVSPPKAGKTTVLKQIAHSIEANNPEVHLMVLLVDERPEEVTDMRRSVKGEVIASTFDRPSEEHTQVAELAIERAKRMVESGRDVVIVLDGITRLARAYNLAQPATGRVMSGGIDTGALYPPKKFFGSARNIEEGGSLTILATALVETGSRMDEVIFEEFKGTGNMELRLDRKLAERRVYPAIDVNGSSTRHEELLFDRIQLQQIWKLRRVLNALGNEGSHAAGLELLMDRIKSTKSNDQFLAEVAKNAVPSI